MLPDDPIGQEEVSQAGLVRSGGFLFGISVAPQTFDVIFVFKAEAQRAGNHLLPHSDGSLLINRRVLSASSPYPVQQEQGEAL